MRQPDFKNTDNCWKSGDGYIGDDYVHFIIWNVENFT